MDAGVWNGDPCGGYLCRDQQVEFVAGASDLLFHKTLGHRTVGISTMDEHSLFNRRNTVGLGAICRVPQSLGCHAGCLWFWSVAWDVVSGVCIFTGDDGTS